MVSVEERTPEPSILKFVPTLIPPIVEEESHFDPETEHSAAKLGMWLFLATELLLFGGLFAAYAIFRAKYPVMFAEGSANLDVVFHEFHMGPSGILGNS